jgi:putative aldouronate transport system permease protein
MAIDTRSEIKQNSALDAKLPRTNPVKGSFRPIWKRHQMLYWLLVPAVVLLILFRIFPFWGVGIAFVKFNPVKGLLSSQWVGLKNFIDVLKKPEIWNVVRNTLFIASGKILLGEFSGLALALLINETRSSAYKKLVQTATTIPHFLSWVIIGALLVSILGSSGGVNDILVSLGLTPVKFLASKQIFPFTLIFSDIWKECGFSAVVYLAALTQISPELFEAAAVDGAGRGARLWYIIIPGILPIFIFMIALNLGSILDAGFEQVLVLYNPAVYSTGDILDTYIYRVGLVNFKYEIATVVGILKAIVGYLAIIFANWASGKLSGYRIF